MRQVLSRAGFPLIALLTLAVPGLPRSASAQVRAPNNEFRILRPGSLFNSATLGVEVRDVRPADVKDGKLPGDLGAWVTGVAEGSAAARAGLKAGDAIVEFDGETVRSAATLARLIDETPAGRSVKMAVIRDGKRADFSVTLEQRRGDNGFSFVLPRATPLVPDIRPFDQPQLPGLPRNPQGPRLAPPLWRFEGQGRLGIGLQELTPQLRQYFGVRQGVLISSVAADSSAERAGIKAGDVITAVDGATVRSAADLTRALGDLKVGDVVTLDVSRDRKPMTIKVTLGGSGARIRPIEGRQGR